MKQQQHKKQKEEIMKERKYIYSEYIVVKSIVVIQNNNQILNISKEFCNLSNVKTKQSMKRKNPIYTYTRLYIYTTHTLLYIEIRLKKLDNLFILRSIPNIYLFEWFFEREKSNLWCQLNFHTSFHLNNSFVKKKKHPTLFFCNHG